MPRKPRLDGPQALHHVICRGIEKCTVFRDDRDRENLLERLSKIVNAGAWRIYAWALIPNHFHLLVRTAGWPLSRSMRVLLTGYAGWFNRRHERSGHLFQNRFKSVLCEDEPYFLELVRYVHLNPFRASVVATLEDLDVYPFSGHSCLMRKIERPWQDVQAVWERFGQRTPAAVARYREFILGGARQGRRPDLEGCLVKGRSENTASRRLGRARECFGGDERVLGSEAFVASLADREPTQDDGAGTTLDPVALARRLAAEFRVPCEAVLLGRRWRRAAEARRVLSYVWIRHLGRSGRGLAKVMNVTPQALYLASAKVESEGAPPLAAIRRWLREA
jgi:putative transposase